jgi:hypothetical protein
MITNPDVLKDLEKLLTQKENLSFSQKLTLPNGLCPLDQYAGHFRHEAVLQGFEQKCETIRILNGNVLGRP